MLTYKISKKMCNENSWNSSKWSITQGKIAIKFKFAETFSFKGVRFYT